MTNTVVLVHGIFDNANAFKYLAKHLSSAGFKLYSLISYRVTVKKVWMSWQSSCVTILKGG